MKLQARFLVVLLAFVAILSAVPLALAQQYCPSGLDSSTCALIVEATTNVSKVKTFQINYFVNAQQVGGTGGSLDITGAGLVDASNPNNPRLATTLKFDVNDNSSSQSGTVDIRLVNNVIYIKYPDLTGDKWGKIDLLKVSNASQQTSDFNTSAAEQLFSLIAQSATMNTSVQDADALEGKPMTKITVEYNVYTLLKTFLNSDARPALRELMKSSGQAMSDAELDRLAQQLENNRVDLENAVLGIHWTIGKSDKLLHNFMLTFHAEAPGKPTANAEVSITLSRMGVPLKNPIAAIPDAVDLIN